jgi:hypothetical protein
MQKNYAKLILVAPLIPHVICIVWRATQFSFDAIHQTPELIGIDEEATVASRSDSHPVALTAQT